ncbi:TonB-dependent receptor [Marinobacterium nitratireducens]|uniref:TonB-dependent receptor n=1 Tax=Marinobacterium nitratireducens TaxID=518897 RepID=A0A917ZKY7_9GAMM|nr:TonB-dependent siderophore receptor [Marinobacterium nitratireducens]GGO84816.1 TonB-dependent receptor [Marinobacterium nitratireducens]
MTGKAVNGPATLRRELDFNRSATIAGTLSLALSSAMITPAFAEELSLDTLVIEDGRIAADANPYAEPDAPYKARRTSDSRRARDIADTPQTMTVLTKDAIEDSGKTELKDILSAQPGITLGTGEGGNSFGDRYIIRGYEARNDVFTDGLRDPGLITRETFALEQIEISKGPSSTFAGRGSTGGAVNSVTKKASLDDDFATVQGGLGTDDYQRYTFDGNKVVNDDLAVRFNTLYTEADIPDREPAGEQRQGALLSGVYQATAALALSADYYYFRGDDRSDPGTFMTDGRPDQDARYVGPDGLDFQDTEADIFTFKIDAELTDELRLENKSRIGSTANDYIVSVYSARSGGLRSFTGWQENDYVGNQTNLIWDTRLGGMRHTIIGGIEYADEDTDAGNYNVTADGSFVVDPYNPVHSGWNGSYGRSDTLTRLNLETVSAYLMDTITLNDDWEIFAGVRYDHFDYDLWAGERTGRGGVIIPEAQYKYSDGFWNGHLGATWSPWEDGNVYATWSTSSNINGGEADAATNCGYGGICTDADGQYEAADPEQSTNLELGTKWNLMDERLLLTAALFRTTKDDVIEDNGDSYATGGNLNTGRNRVEGIELGLSGNITDRLSGQAGIALMNSETLDSYDEANIGRPKANFAEKSANIQLRYQATPAFAFGGVMTYSSEIFGGQPDAAARTSIRLPGYTVYDAFVSYDFSPQLNLRANVQNLFDKDYYTATYRGGSIVYIGDGRAANLALTYRF